MAGAIGPDLYVAIDGELDLAAVKPLDAALKPLTADGPFRRVIIDASGISFCDSTGMQWLLRLTARFRAEDIRLINVHPRVARTFDAAGLHRVLVHASPEIELIGGG